MRHGRDYTGKNEIFLFKLVFLVEYPRAFTAL